MITNIVSSYQPLKPTCGLNQEWVCSSANFQRGHQSNEETIVYLQICISVKIKKKTNKTTFSPTAKLGVIVFFTENLCSKKVTKY